MSPIQVNEKPHFLHVDTNLHKLKVDQKFIGLAWPEMGVAGLITAIENWVYLKNELMERIDFLHGGANSGKQKVISKIFDFPGQKWMWSFSS